MKAVIRDLNLLTKKNERLDTKMKKTKKATKAKARPKVKAKARAKARPKVKAKAKAKAKARPKAKAKAKARPKAKAKAKAKRAPARKKAAKKITASQTILNIIKRRKSPISTAELKQRTRFKDNNIRMIVYRLKKRGEIKSVRKGVYQRA